MQIYNWDSNLAQPCGRYPKIQPNQGDEEVMRWWRKCCCCFWNAPPPADERLLKDTSFCLPRRHSSFHATTDHVTSTQRCSTSSSSSSSGEEDVEGGRRGRSWSTIPSLSTTTDSSDHKTAKKKKKSRSCSFSNATPKGSGAELSFDRHILTEIAETAEEEQSNKQRANEIYGYLTFSTAYDERELRLEVSVERAVGLPKKSPQEAYNTFVKMSITSSSSSLSTRAIKNTLSPVYREEHLFHTNRSKWTSTNHCLKLSVFDCDRQGRHDAIGHALLPLTQLSSSGRKQKQVLPLTPMSIPTKKNLGQVLLGLSYIPAQSLLCVQVLKARHLTLDSDIHKRILHKETMDTFAKVSLMCAGQKVKSNASRVVFGASDPFYNFKNSFVLPPQFMLDASVIVSVLVRGILGRSFTLGRAISGPYTELSEGTPTQWGRMVQENRNIVQWRNLYL